VAELGSSCSRWLAVADTRHAYWQTRGENDVLHGRSWQLNRHNPVVEYLANKPNPVTTAGPSLHEPPVYLDFRPRLDLTLHSTHKHRSVSRQTNSLSVLRCNRQLAASRAGTGRAEHDEDGEICLPTD